VHAVSPTGGPDDGVDAVDPGFFVQAAGALLDGLGTAGVGRLVAMGLGANLLGTDGRMVPDDPVASLRRCGPSYWRPPLGWTGCGSVGTGPSTAGC
jgi:hypothetical protein